MRVCHYWPRRLLQISLRQLLIFICIVGALMGLLARVRYRVAVQERTIAAIRKNDGDVQFDYQEANQPHPPGPAFLRWLLGEHAFAKVTHLWLRKEFVSGIPEAFPDAEVLWLSEVSLGDKSLQAIRKLPRLRHLNLSNSLLDSAALTHLRRLDRVDTVILDGASATDDSVGAVAEMTSVRSLGILNTKLQDAPWNSLRHLERLEILQLSQVSQDAPISMACIRELPNLQVLMMRGVGPVDGTSIGDLSGLSKLENMMLTSVQVQDSGLDWLTAPPRLRSLFLEDTEISPRADEQLVHCVNLSDLQLRDTKLDDSAAAFLAKLSSMRYLDIHGTNISDDGLRMLSSLKSLKSLSVSTDNGITEAGITELKRALPNVQVFENDEGDDFVCGGG